MGKFKKSIRKALDSIFSNDEKDRDNNNSYIYTYTDNINSKRHQDMLTEQLCLLLQERQGVTLGNMQVLGLSAIRERLGEKWSRFSKKVEHVARDIINKNVGEDDYIFEIGELKFLIFFGTKNQKEALAHCALVSALIWHKVFGDDKGYENLQTKISVVDFDDDLAFYSEETLNNLADYVEGKGKVLDIKSSDLSIRNVSDQNKHDLKSKPDSHTLTSQNIESLCTLTNESTSKRPTGTQCSIASDEDVPTQWHPINKEIRNISYQFQPIWDIEKNAVISYFLETLVDGQREAKLDADIKVDPSIRSKINLGSLDKAINTLKQRNNLNDTIVPIITNVFVESLNDHWFVDSYQQALNKVPYNLRKYLGIEIIGYDHTRPSQVPSFLKSLQNKVGLVLAEAILIRDFASYENTGINSLVMPSKLIHSDKAIVSHVFERFVTLCKERNIVPYTKHLDSIALTLAAINAGFKFVSGDIISKPIQDTASAYKFSMTNLSNHINDFMINKESLTDKQLVGWFLLRLRLERNIDRDVIYLPFNKKLAAQYLELPFQNFCNALKEFESHGFHVEKEKIKQPSAYSLCDYCYGTCPSLCKSYNAKDCPKFKGSEAVLEN